MEKEFVPYALALRLKALGFDEPCFGYYHIDLEEDKVLLLDDYEYFMEGIEFSCNAPTFSQAFRWIKENYGLKFHIWEDKWNHWCTPKILIKETNEYEEICGVHNTYEKAELACLEKLIEIVESNKFA